MHNFKYFFREGAGNMLSHGFMSFAAVGVTVACLLIMGTFSLVAYNANINLQDLQKENAVVAFVDESLTDDEATALQSRLAAIPGVADCTFVSRQEARDEYVAQYNEDDLYSDLDPSIFRHRYVMHLTDLNRMGQVVQSLESVEGIAKVRADQDISNGFITVRNIAGVISIALIAILLIISVFIISNTIRLTVFARRKEIAIMKYVGATNWFIRWPFLLEGLLLGFIGGVLADLALCQFYGFVVTAVHQSLAFLPMVSVYPFMYRTAAILLVISMIIGALGSTISLKRYMKV